MDEYNPQMEYELLLRGVFGKKNAPKIELGRYGDPAEIANTDYFSDHSINVAKAGLGYAAAILQNWSPEDDDEINALMSKIWPATSISELIPVLKRLRSISEKIRQKNQAS